MKLRLHGWTLGLALVLTQISSAQATLVTFRALVEHELRSASTATGVPYELLAGIAMIESRWIMPSPHRDGEHPPLYGVMGLRDDSWFGSSVSRAAALAGVSKATIKQNLHWNVRGAALLLKKLQLREDPGALRGSDLRRWKEAVLNYTGIPAREDRELYWEDLERLLARGHSRSGIQIAPNEQLRKLIGGNNHFPPKQPPDIDFDPSPNFTPNAIKQRYVAIHTTQGSFASAVSWLKNPRANASAHYIIRASDGYIKQLVKDTDKAWHIRCWNPLTIGIEHEGFVEDPESYTEALVQTSANLVKRILADFKIPADDMHVWGHDFWTTERYQRTMPADLPNCNDHTDPGMYWDWPKYYGLLAP